MFRRALLAATLALLTIGASPVGDFRTLVTDANKAIQAGDYATAREKLRIANNLVPNYPSIYALEAMAAAKAGDVEAALDWLDRYSKTGLYSRIWQDPAFAEVTKSHRFESIRRRFDSNLAPVGRVETVFSIPETPFLAESLVRDEPRRRWLVSSVRLHKIVAVDDAGRVRDFATLCRGVFGLNLFKNNLFAATTASPQTTGATAQGTALTPVPLPGGAVPCDRYAPEAAPSRSFGDLTRLNDGRILVADSFAGEILVLDGRKFTSLSKEFASPQGMVPTPDGRRVIVADYPGGLFVLDLKTRAVTRLPTPPDLVAVFIDGMTRDGNTVIAVQNGTNPQRILRLTFDRSWTRVTRWDVLAANLPTMREPTGGVLYQGDFVFVAKSQWDAFDDDGKLKQDKPEPAEIGRLRLH